MSIIEDKMKYGICLNTLMPVRAAACETAEMVTQVLFGEFYLIIEEQIKWCKIQIENDGYEGWVDSKLIELIEEEEKDNLKRGERIVCNVSLSSVKKNNMEMPLIAGSVVYGSNKTYTIAGYNFNLYDNFETLEKNGNNAVILAKQFINAPYLWGGKTVLGVDCSGLTQLVFNILGLKLPRDASQQIAIGENVSFINEAQEGDLAFFDNEEGMIIHVGIMLNNHEIIHASGYVRIDAMDHQGIFDKKLNKYTHRLRMIKRVL